MRGYDGDEETLLPCFDVRYKYRKVKDMPETANARSFLMERLPDIEGRNLSIQPCKVVWKTPLLFAAATDELIIRDAIRLWGLNLPNVVRVQNAGYLSDRVVREDLLGEDDWFMFLEGDDCMVDLEDLSGEKKEYVRERGVPYVETEFLDGGYLRDFIDIHRSLELAVPAPVILHIIKGIALGCDQVYKVRKSVHDGLCPEVVGFTSSGTVKVTEYGMSEWSVHYKSSEPFRPTLLHLSYSSPEMLGPLRFRKYDTPHHVSNDIFSIGMIGYELATLHNPLAELRRTGGFTWEGRFSTGREDFSFADERLDDLVLAATNRGTLCSIGSHADLVKSVDNAVNISTVEELMYTPDVQSCRREDFAFYLRALKSLYSRTYAFSKTGVNLAGYARCFLEDERIFEDECAKRDLGLLASGRGHPFIYMEEYGLGWS